MIFSMNQEPLYPEGHLKRIEEDSQRTNIDTPSSSKKKKKKNDRTLHASCEPVADTPENPNDIFLFLMLKHNLVMNMNLVIMLMMMFILMLNLVVSASSAP